MTGFVFRLSRFTWEHILFFGFLFALVLLGDGKQPIGDVVAAAGILCLFVIRRMNGETISHLPPLVTTTWATLLLYLVVRTIFSDSVGYSVTATIRWFMAYLVFVFFSSGPHDEKHNVRFSNSMLWFGVLVVLTSVVVTVFELLGRALPGMNLLYPTFGHNHAANIIVFALPLALYRRPLLAVFFGLALVFSFARGAWLLMGGYLAYVLLASRGISARAKQMGVGVVLAGALAVFMLPGVSNYLPPVISGSPLLQRQIVKESILANRLQYWKQAAAAIQQSPLFGAGPGTFYLLSKRLQEAPGSYSWFAHSFPLELFSEIGAIGLIGVIWLIGGVLRGAKRGPLFHGVVLTLAYSLYEMNLNFLVVWLLFWAAMGILFARARQEESKLPAQNHLLVMCLGVLALFYLSSVAASVVGLFPNMRLFSFYSEPYIVGRAKNMLIGEKAALPRELQIIELFHKKDPEVLAAAGLFERAIAQDPHNVEYLAEYIDFLLKKGNTAAIARALGVNLDLSPFLTKELFVDVGRPTVRSEFLAKAYYFLGFTLLSRDPEQTRSFWTLARDLAPEWGYFHVELASLDYHVVQDKEQANNILINCRKFRFASAQCNDTKINDTNPGDQYENIKAIPTTRKN